MLCCRVKLWLEKWDIFFLLCAASLYSYGVESIVIGLLQCA